MHIHVSGKYCVGGKKGKEKQFDLEQRLSNKMFWIFYHRTLLQFASNQVFLISSSRYLRRAMSRLNFCKLNYRVCGKTGENILAESHIKWGKKAV